MNAYGLGGAIMLDYERYREDSELDIEVRYTKIQLRTFGSTTSGLKGESSSEMLAVLRRNEVLTGMLQVALIQFLHLRYTPSFKYLQGRAADR